MRVLLTADPIGGVWSYALELAQALAPNGVHMTLATMGAPLGRDQWAEAEGAGLEVFESPLKLEWMDDPWEDVAQAGDWLLGLEADFRPDVIHLNGYAHGGLPWSAPVLVAGHSCVLSWWEAVKGEPAPASWARYRREVRRGLQAAELVVAPTAAMLAALERHYGPLPHARVIPNGRSRSAFFPGAKEPFILTAGRLWDEAKNVAMLQDIAPELDWPVLVTGDAQHPDGRSVQHSSLRSLGHLAPAELASWLSRASIYALPARYEPFGLSALEAALSGCALVVSDIASLREVWGDAALFVPPDDPDAWTATLVCLSQDTARRNCLAERAQECALGFPPERMAQSYLKAYRSLVSKRPTEAMRADVARS